MENEKIIEGVLQEFAGLAKHPRKSGHEKKSVIISHPVCVSSELLSYRMKSITLLLMYRRQKDMKMYR